jgi:signal transduction histidine kinase
MNERTAGRVAWGVALFCFAMAGATLVMTYLNRGTPTTGNGGPNLIPSVTFGALGGLVASRQPRNLVGWLMLAVAVCTGASTLGAHLATRVLLSGVSPLGWARWLRVFSLSTLALGSLILVFLLFPDGRPLNKGWRWVAWASVVLPIGFVAFSALDPTPVELSPRLPRLGNPIGVRALAGFNNGPWFLVILILLLLAAVGLLVRLRRSRGEEHQQMKWFVYAAGVSVGSAVLAIPAQALSPTLSNVMFSLGFNLGFAFLVPAAAAIAILRYGLYEIDVVINKTVLYALLAAFFTAVYVAVVVGIGAAIGSAHNAFLTLVAAAVIAVAFNPVRDRAKRLADRLVYGERATPYEVLSEFSERMAGTYALDDILPRMARVLAEGTGGQAEIWLRVGDVLRSVGSWPNEGATVAPPRELAAAGGTLPTFDGASKATPVLHQGEPLGAVTVTKPANDPLRPTEDKLIEDVASQAGLVLRNVRLIEELRASRQRIVAAQDAAARRLERNIHDGAQQQLVALTVKQRLAASLVSPGDERLRAMIEELASDTTSALEDLRDLARGIYPPLLADKGLVAALGSQGKRSPVPVNVESDGIGRYSQEIEAAVYFCCLEGLQNVAKYAEATTATIRLADGADSLTFEVTDDGRGFDPASTGYGTGLQGMADRLDALGGSLEVRSVPGQGTRIVGRVPAR